MHTNYYDHGESEPAYKRYCMNIAYRYGFDVVEESDLVWKKEEDAEDVLLADGGFVPRNMIWYRAWKALLEQHEYNGMH